MDHMAMRQAAVAANAYLDRMLNESAVNAAWRWMDRALKAEAELRDIRGQPNPQPREALIHIADMPPRA